MVKARTAALRGKQPLRTGAGRIGVWVAASCLLLGGVGRAHAAAPPTVAQMLSFRPRQEGVVITTPAPEKQSGCKVELVKGQGGRGSGWVLKDESDNLLRKFFDSNDDGRVDVWSYYKDGAEVYSEIDTTYTGKPDQYRWLNAGGMKWGVDETKEGRIKYWKAISPEEVSQELLQALIAHDQARFQALVVSETEIKALGLAAAQTERIREQVKTAAEKFQDTVTKLGPKLNPKTSWLHLETAAPQCVPSETGGEVIRHARGTVLFDVGGGNDWVQTGEMIQVGVNAWRLAGGPTPGAAPPAAADGTPGAIENPEVQKLVEELTKLDKEIPPSENGPSAASVRHHLARADLLEKIVAKVKPQERDPWIRQVADSLGTAAQSSPAEDSTALERLRSLEAQLVKYLPGHNLTAYVTFREMQADYSAKIAAKKVAFEKVQAEWLERLGKFVQAYPKADDAADALLQAGMVAEFLGKDVEAKNWYAQLVRNYADKPQAKKAEGSVRRLDLEGKPLKLSGPLLNDSNTAFDLEQLAGKVVAVYYWASWNSHSPGDFAKLKTLVETYGSKGFDVVCVNLDSSAEEARRFVRNATPVGTHLYGAGGLEGKLAIDYGITVLPNLFLVGRDGKVVNRSAQIGNVEEEIKKLTK